LKISNKRRERMPKRISLMLKVTVAIAIVALFAATEVMAQVEGGCIVTVPGKGKADPLTFIVDPVYDAGKFLIDVPGPGSKNVSLPGGGSIDLDCTAAGLTYPCVATLYRIFESGGAKFSKVYLSFDAEVNSLFEVATHPSGYEECEACNADCYFRSCASFEIAVTYQPNDDSDRLVIYYKDQTSGNVLSAGMGQFAGTFAKNTFICEPYLLAASTVAAPDFSLSRDSGDDLCGDQRFCTRYTDPANPCPTEIYAGPASVDCATMFAGGPVSTNQYYLEGVPIEDALQGSDSGEGVFHMGTTDDACPRLCMQIGANSDNCTYIPRRLYCPK
jgi:hypothetical protein